MPDSRKMGHIFLHAQNTNKVYCNKRCILFTLLLLVMNKRTLSSTVANFALQKPGHDDDIYLIRWVSKMFLASIVDEMGILKKNCEALWSSVKDVCS